MFDMYKQMNEIDDNASLISKKPAVKSRKLVESVNHKLRIVEGYSVKHGRGKPAIEFDSLDAAVQHINDGMSKKSEDSYILYNDGKEMIWLDWYQASRDGSNNNYTVSRQNDNSVELKDGKLVAKTTLKEADEESVDEQPADNGSDVTNTVEKLKAADYENFVKILNSDGKSKAFMDFLNAHYKSGDDSIGTIKKANAAEGVATCSDLMPTQQNISVVKSFDFLKEGGWSEKVINDPLNAFNTPTITYAGKYIIDGHHRWSKVYAIHGPSAQLKVLNFPQISGVSWEDMLKAVQLAIRSNAASLDLQNKVDNPNMLQDKTGETSAQVYIKIACDEVVAAMKAKGYGDTKEAQAAKVAQNVASMAKTGSVPGAEPREWMPQTDKIDKTGDKVKNTLVQKGVIDMTEGVDTMSESTGRVTLEVRFEEYTRYGGGGIRTAKISGKDEFAALLRMCDKMHLYIDSDWAEEVKEETGSYPTVERIINNIGMSNGDGCDYIVYIKNLTSGETLLDEGEPEEYWDDDVEGDFFEGLAERLYDDEVGSGWNRNTPYSSQSTGRVFGGQRNDPPQWWKDSGRSANDWSDAKRSSINSWDESDRYNR